MKRDLRPRSLRLWAIALALLMLAGLLAACEIGPVPLPSPTAAPSPLPPANPPSPSPPTVAPSPAPAHECGNQAAAMIPSRAGDLARLAGASCYVLDVQIEPEQSRLSGQMSVRYTNREDAPLDQIVFRLFPNLPDRLGRSTVRDLTRDGQPLQSELQQQNTILLASLTPPLPAGASAVFSLAFDVDIPTSARAGYQEFVNREGIIALAGFYPLIPARRDGQWDLEIPPSHGDVVTADAALYHVSVTAPRMMVVAGAGVMLSQRDEVAAQTKTLQFVSGPAREFNLIVSSDYEVLSQAVGETLVLSYFRPAERAGAERALRVASDALRVFNDLFGVYPLAELKLAPTTTTAGGIEYPGLIVLNQFYYTGQRNERFDWANVHEVAHQWWYNVVGNDQVQEPWLDEALTNYSTLLYYERTTDAVTAGRLKAEVFDAPAAQALKNGADQPIGKPVSAYKPADYGAIVYGKGPLFFHALRERVGDDAFFRILREYRRRFEYRMATGLDFLALAQEIAGQDLRPLYDEWIAGR